MILGEAGPHIQQDTIVPPSGKWNQVSVFCVEQGDGTGEHEFARGRRWRTCH